MNIPLFKDKPVVYNKLPACASEPYNIMTCESYEYAWSVSESFDDVVDRYVNEKSQSGWKLSGGAGSEGERFGSLINNNDSDQNIGIKIARVKGETQINIYIPYTFRVH